ETGARGPVPRGIAGRAGSNVCAAAACDTITPRRGSLIVFLEILLQLPALGETLDQAVVEGARRVHPAVPQQVVHRHDLTDYGEVLAGVERDRKSTRLNSSHQIISYAVFCLKKKKTDVAMT